MRPKSARPWTNAMQARLLMQAVCHAALLCGIIRDGIAEQPDYKQAYLDRCAAERETRIRDVEQKIENIRTRKDRPRDPRAAVADLRKQLAELQDGTQEVFFGLNIPLQKGDVGRLPEWKMHVVVVRSDHEALVNVMADNKGYPACLRGPIVKGKTELQMVETREVFAVTGEMFEKNDNGDVVGRRVIESLGNLKDRSPGPLKKRR